MKKRVVMATASLAAINIWASQAYAQSEPAAASGKAASSQEVEELIVTARRVEESIQDIPLAVSSVSGEALQRQSIRDVRDLSSTVPNMMIQQGNADAQAAVATIRGQGGASPLLSVDNAVGLYVDNLNNPRAYGLRAGLVDVQRVEVLRGPQGTLYGRNTTGGAISIFTRDPTDTFGGSLQLSAGNYSAFNALGVINAPLADGVSLRLVGQYDHHDSYFDSPANPDNKPMRSDGYYFRGKLKVERGGFRLSLTADIFDYETGGMATRFRGLVDGTVANVPGAVAPTAANPTGAGPVTVLGGAAAREVQLETGLPFTPAGLSQASALLQTYVNRGSFYESYSGSEVDGQGDGKSVVLNLDYDVNDYLTLRSISGYRYVSRFSPLDNDGTPFLLAPGRSITEDDFYSQELQILGAGERLDWVAGAFYSYEDGFESARPQTNFFTSNGNTALQNGAAVSKSYAFFSQGNYRILDNLTLTVGARWTKETKRVVLTNSNLSAAGVTTCAITGAAALAFLTTPGVCSAKFENSFSDPSWLASLKYDFSDDVSAYVKFTRGFRGGGQQIRATGPNVGTYAPFEPETVTEYEIGLKSQLFDNSLRLNLAAFWDDYKDVQRSIVFIVGSTGVTATQNAAKARLWGVETEANLRVNSALTLDASIGYINPKYIDFRDFSGPGATLRDRTGEDWPVPDWNVRVGGRYVAPTQFGDLALSLNYVWQSDFNIQANARFPDQVTQKAYGLLNGRLSLTLEDSGLEIALFGRNLLQKHYFTSGISFEAIGFNVLQQGDPRVVGVQVTKKFGGER